MRLHILEIPQGSDVMLSIDSFARSGPHAAVAVLSANGLVRSVILENGRANRRRLTLSRAHRIVSLSGYLSYVEGFGFGSFDAILTFASGQVIGGTVVGSFVAVTPVRVVVLVTSDNGTEVTLPFLPPLQWRPPF